MYEWFINDWIHLVVVHPETCRLLYFKDGDFTDYVPAKENVETINDITVLVEQVLFIIRFVSHN